MTAHLVLICGSCLIYAYISKTYKFYSRQKRISCFLGAVSCGMGMEARHDRIWRCIMREKWREHKKWTFWVLNITNLNIQLSTHSKTLQASPLTSLHLLPLSDDTTAQNRSIRPQHALPTTTTRRDPTDRVGKISDAGRLSISILV